MLRRSIATPCPVNHSLADILHGDTDNTTTTFDFTTEFRASLREAKPRRRQTQSVQFTLYEDPGEEELPPTSRQTALSQPPRRVRPSHIPQYSDADKTACQDSIVHEEQDEQAPTCMRFSHGSRLGQAPRRPAVRLSVLPESATKDITAWFKPPSPKPTRPARRGTIFIPNDDTTMPSMYMGIFSPIKEADLRPEATAEEPQQRRLELTEAAPRTTAKRAARPSIIGTAPRRAPLQQSKGVFQETASTIDRYGQGRGKENVPPGATVKDQPSRYPTTKGIKSNPRRISLYGPSACEKVSVNLQAPTKSWMLKHESSRPVAEEKALSRPAWNGGVRPGKSKSNQTIEKPSKSTPPINIAIQAAKVKVPTRFVIPVVQPETVLQDHALLAENIVNPTLYENDWLQHQEIAMTQLVNNLFSASWSHEHHDHPDLRRRLIAMYDTAAIALMHKRLQAALLYGSLSIPQDVLKSGARLQNDIGLKKQFTDLWLCSYDLRLLELALEVVVGRECCSSKLRTSEGNHSSSNISKSGLRNFIEAFIIRNEDGKPGRDASSRVSWSYQRTVLRSLMLVRVLDLIKTGCVVNTADCLFQHGSPFKSSVAVIQALTQMLNPAAGDPIRALSHIDFKVIHVQHPLAEIDYHIDNLAVDLRDGTRLTRIVEILLYPSASHALEKSYDIDNTTTLILPEGETLEFSEGQDWPLSQHLKAACQSRAVKIWNVELALSAIRNVKGMSNLIDGIFAEDIVDGFREKTLRLLWALVGKWGLVGLLDWHDLRWEIRRLNSQYTGSMNVRDYDEEFDEETEINTLSVQSCKTILRCWAKAVAFSRGMTIHNFTTSFADGKAFEAIVDEYQRYIPTEDASPKTTTSLQDRLTRLGCSAQFSGLFAKDEKEHVFDRDFVLASLAFLCSRLLAPTRRARAATVIQTAWRKHWVKIAEVRRQEKRSVALACAQMVKARLATSNTGDVTCAMNTAINTKPTLLVRSNDIREPLSPLANEEDIWLSL